MVTKSLLLFADLMAVVDDENSVMMVESGLMKIRKSVLTVCRVFARRSPVGILLFVCRALVYNLEFELVYRIFAHLQSVCKGFGTVLIVNCFLVMQGIFGLAVDLILRSKLVFALDFLMNHFGTYVSLLYAQASTFNAVFILYDRFQHFAWALDNQGYFLFNFWIRHKASCNVKPGHGIEN
ncbi:unnamed protein product [Vicia faba]|uniref:Uncharacterized protein n=1 Tax=Vicia faba TaxID=3906 RepID=A0AAV0ZFU7_VICFA|nr:unnamed protein product [Vicia faba]